ncbi:MAG: DUF362 domain-containing protein [Acidobacteriaceae bacterium]|nr:DUF362 domain-containing protein [Acidobacteriaceae bacterium]
MRTGRRQFIEMALAGAGAALARAKANAPATAKLGMPGPHPGRVIAVEHSGCIVSGTYQPQPVREMVQRGMTELTEAPTWQDAWRSMFEKGDVVGIKVSPVGGAKLCSDASVLHAILDGLNQAGVSDSNIVVFNRYREEAIEAGIDKWLRPGIRFEAASPRYDNSQLGMGGYDENHFMELAIVKPGDDPNDPHCRRSYAAKIVTTQVNKVINLPVLKHHQSAGVTITLKNMSHGFVNNVNRSHITPTANACGIFIPSVVSMPIIREKVVLHVVDAVKASYHGGPSSKPQFVWEQKKMYFGTDPVALDKTGWKVIDAKRQQGGMAPIALSKPDKNSHYLNCQVEHIEIAGMMGLGEFSDDKIKVSQVHLA